MTDYDVYAPDEVPWELREDAVPLPEAEAVGSWCVLVEQANGGQASPPTRIVVVAEDLHDRASAMAEARTQAFEYRPPDPVMPRLRQVFEDDEGFLTIVEGAVSTFHFRTRVMRLSGVV